ncbi:MAG TPA: helix-turn-helix transcriptional regulator [Solirubrobacteraceae bacterium]|nr:helix-turn-helix transcriptional regulator [Solirubrobacteraceae bacterium]
MTHISAHVAKSVAAHRTVARLSQAQLAVKAGISRQAVDQIERGTITPTLKTLEALASAFGVRAADLLP